MVSSFRRSRGAVGQGRPERSRRWVRVATTEARDAAKKAFGRAEEKLELTGTLLTVVTLGVLARLAPWALEYLGFAEEGTVADSFAAGWQSRYAEKVPKGNLFSYLQRLDSTLRREGWFV